MIALLPMKGHSERVPNKNMKPFAGVPLYHIVTKTLLETSRITQVAINTDSQAIAQDAIDTFGREKIFIVWRPEAIRGDFVSMNQIIAYDLKQLNGEHFLQTHSTNPLLRRETLNRAIELYFAGLGKYDSLFSVTRVQTRLYWQDGRPINHNLSELKRTQDLPIIFEENSNFYIFSRDSFSRARENRIGIEPRMFDISKLEAVDIDEPDDFELAELLYMKNLEASKDHP